MFRSLRNIFNKILLVSIYLSTIKLLLRIFRTYSVVIENLINLEDFLEEELSTFSKSKFLALLSITLLLSACGSSNAQNMYEEVLECNLSAQQLIQSKVIEDDRVLQNIQQYASEQPYANDLTEDDKHELDRKAQEIFNRFEDPGMNGLKGGLFYPLKVYNSSTCMKMHKQNKIDVGSLGLEAKVMYYAAYLFV